MFPIQFYSPQQPDFHGAPLLESNSELLDYIPNQGELVKVGDVTYGVKDVMSVINEHGVEVIKIRLS